MEVSERWGDNKKDKRYSSSAQILRIFKGEKILYNYGISSSDVYRTKFFPFAIYFQQVCREWWPPVEGLAWMRRWHYGKVHQGSHKDRTLDFGSVIWEGFPHAPGTWDQGSAAALSVGHLPHVWPSACSAMLWDSGVCAGPALGTGHCRIQHLDVVGWKLAACAADILKCHRFSCTDLLS